jgi:thiol-disulfide isomerase/thioredoxin
LRVVSAVIEVPMRTFISSLLTAVATLLAHAGAASAQWATPQTGYTFETPSACPLPAKRYDACADQMALFTAALAKAQAANRKLLVVFGADWCPWCRTIDGNLPTADYLDHADLKGRIDVVNIAVSVATDGRRLRLASGIAVQTWVASDMLFDKATGGIPFFALVDPTTDRLAIGMSNGRFATVIDDKPANLAPEFRALMTKSLGAMDAFAAAKAKTAP